MLMSWLIVWDEVSKQSPWEIAIHWLLRVYFARVRLFAPIPEPKQLLFLLSE